MISEGSRPAGIHVVLEGWACRYKTLRDGGRHIPALLLPGDFCDLQAAMLDRMDHGIAAITPLRVACISQAQLAAFTAERPNIVLALQWATLVDLSALRTWMVGLSGRSALGRVAHLVCELRDRSFNANAGDRNHFPFPLTQVELADATGQTAVHANRIVSQLRSSRLADIRGGSVTILDGTALESVAEYDPAYLHLDQAARADLI
ncbi:MAG: Crp/Fnr family transcriptional regulator [Sphingomonas sp.]|nr:MAG: Crp/Fnr family transcriptional regulator [Sphingomonas sp.]